MSENERSPASAMTIGVAILAGGRSSRMGRPKATLTIGGNTLIERIAVESVRSGLGAPTVIGGESHWAAGSAWVPDEHPGTGPLDGLITALRTVNADAVLVLACDLVTPNAQAFDQLAERFRFEQLADPPADVVAPRSQRREVLHAVYHGRIVRQLARSFSRGERSINRAISSRAIIEINVDSHPHLKASIRDADFPNDLLEYDVR